jgi:hypothetical protein
MALRELTRTTRLGVYYSVGLFRMRCSVAPILLAVGESPFVGMWQTGGSRVTDKPEITVLIVELEKRLGGAVVLVNPHASVVKLPILNLKITENVMEF